MSLDNVGVPYKESMALLFAPWPVTGPANYELSIP